MTKDLGLVEALQKELKVLHLTGTGMLLFVKESVDSTIGISCCEA